MNRKLPLRGACLLAALASGCTGTTTPTAPASQPLISDELHNAGTVGFLFLPPMVPRPAHLGDIVPELPVTLRIDEIDGGGKTIRSLRTFSTLPREARPNSRITYHVVNTPPGDGDGDLDPEGYYVARWNTDQEQLSVKALYRVRVLVPARGGRVREIGFADVDVVRNQREFRTVDTQNFAPLINGETLRIKFRVDRPAVDADGDGVFDWDDNCPNTANANQLDSLKNGVGDACRCDGVKCAPIDGCHTAGTCSGKTGTCDSPPLPGGGCAPGSCVDGFADCDGKAGNGCEVDLGADVQNCGACGKACLFLHGTGKCGAGGFGGGGVAGCALAACDAGWSNCDANDENGCEADLSSDVKSCGACGNSCPSGPGSTAACFLGKCAITCDAGRADCDGDPKNGCEVDLLTNAKSCGACGRGCGNGASCVAGVCTGESCAAGTADCNGDRADACEVKLTGDPNNCGGCGTVCSFAHAFPTCTESACGFAVCEMGYADCDGELVSGCETDLASDAKNCGGCGNACDSGQVCRAGLCTDAVVALGRGPSSGTYCYVRSDDELMCRGPGEPRFARPRANAVAKYWSTLGRLLVVNGLGGPIRGSVAGSVYTYGQNASGQLGDGTFVDREELLPVLSGPGTPLRDATATSSGSGFTCALLVGGTVRCWGLGTSGQLGDGKGETRAYASTDVSGIKSAVSLACADAFCAAALADGTVSWWGAVPNEKKSIEKTPVAAAGFKDITQVTATKGLLVALRKDGFVTTAVMGVLGGAAVGALVQNVDDTPLGNVAEVMAWGGGSACARLLKGQVACWGSVPGDFSVTPNPKAQLLRTTKGGSFVEGVSALGGNADAMYLLIGNQLLGFGVLSVNAVDCFHPGPIIAN